MESLSDYLKQARKKKGLSLENVASQTRIPERHLQALEAEDFANLPAKVFVKGFVRSYAKVLGVDEEEALQLFLRTSGTFYEQQQPDQSQPHVQVKLDAAPRPTINWSLVIGALVLIAIGGIWYGLPNHQESPIALTEPESPIPTEPTEQPVPPTPLPSVDITTGNPVDSPSIPPDPPKPASPPPTPNPIPPITAKPILSIPPPATEEESAEEESHALEIEATQLTWVVVQSDDQIPNEALLQPGQRITWKAHEQFQLTLGNAAGVVIRLNGQPQGPFGKPGQVVRDIRLRP